VECCLLPVCRDLRVGSRTRAGHAVRCTDPDAARTRLGCRAPARDTAFIESILADEFVGTYDDGSRADKKRELALAAAFNQQIDASRLEDFTIQLHGDMAVVMFTLHLRGPMQGRPTELALRYLDVWVRRDGRWQCVASQSTRISR
jgi:ketosteroid isomerase-like protein